MRDLLELLTAKRPAVPLDRAALDIARIEYPDLDPEPWVARLDAMAARVAQIAGPQTGALDFIDAVNHVLFGEFKLRGNDREYYDARNSCLNDVLDRGWGIPITLSVVYIEVARRLGRPIYGIGLPAHFVLQYDDGQFQTYIDPFHAGELLSRADCVRLVRERTGAPPAASAFLACSPKQIALRMIQNLKRVYVQAGAYEKALAAMDLIVSASPAAPEEYKQRAVVLLQLRRYRASMSDLDRYLKLAPAAEDRSDVVKQIEAIHRYLGALN